ncbi:hypothetical protein CYMTET_20808 [Cymbomonas tetramitiformis]|uniref:Uncharacterized protein n=1 Tax=Cymbomonas tetramitiformis TaxID=36881 RepID=A0AAE0L3I0_9CHLO|nr:hypothetical protein CYMTET_20808 [Cymbomonas tetramitiformis]
MVFIGLGGHGWEKDWRIGQIGWWHDAIDHLADWGDAHKEVAKEGKGKILRLLHLQEEGYDRPIDLLDALEMFIKVALLVQRVPVLPEIPCSLTQPEHVWPASCPHSHAFTRWYVIYANESQPEPTFHCTMNDRSCTHTCLKTGWLTGHLEPYYATGTTFRGHFPGPPRELQAPAFVKGEATSAALQEYFAAAVDAADVAISAAHLPHDVTELTQVDRRRLWGCATFEGAKALMECVTNGPDSRMCSDLDKPQSRVRRDIDKATPLDNVTWQAYDYIDDAVRNRRGKR